MNQTYHYNKGHHRRRRRIFSLLFISVVILMVIGGFIGFDLYRHRFHPVSGAVQTVAQASTVNTQQVIDQPTYSFKLPSDWKQIKTVNAPTEHSITWQASKKDESNRFLQIYVDTIPRLAINKALPVHSDNGAITYDDLSENCASFTEGGSFDARVAIRAKETPAKWQKLDFICDLPKVFDNVVGTISDDGVNQINVTGPTKGNHKYFFLYTDRNIRPNYTIFYDALTSFRAL